MQIKTLSYGNPHLVVQTSSIALEAEIINISASLGERDSGRRREISRPLIFPIPTMQVRIPAGMFKEKGQPSQSPLLGDKTCLASHDAMMMLTIVVERHQSFFYCFSSLNV